MVDEAKRGRFAYGLRMLGCSVLRHASPWRRFIVGQLSVKPRPKVRALFFSRRGSPEKSVPPLGWHDLCFPRLVTTNKAFRAPDSIATPRQTKKYKCFGQACSELA